jgi:hypothetical protein
MFEAFEPRAEPNGRAVWYMDRDIKTKLGQQSALLTKNSSLTIENTSAVGSSPAGSVFRSGVWMPCRLMKRWFRHKEILT